tara:strand:+ start:3375 stop:3599 length:225 start_codon:yes stop_codon:yes gene_type:complete
MKYNLIRIIKLKYPKIKNKRINEETDLIDDLILDSLELMGLIIHLERNCNFKTKVYLKNNNKFKIKLIQKFINS